MKGNSSFNGVPTAKKSCKFDFDESGLVVGSDLATLLGGWGPCERLLNELHGGEGGPGHHRRVRADAFQAYFIDPVQSKSPIRRLPPDTASGRGPTALAVTLQEEDLLLMTKKVMPILAVLLLGSVSFAGATTSRAVQEAPETEWAPPGSFELETKMREGVLKIGNATFDSTILFKSRPSRGQNRASRTDGLIEMLLVGTALVEGEGGEQGQLDYRFVINGYVIARALEWLDSTTQLEEWAKRAEIPAGSQMKARISSGEGSSRNFIDLVVAFDGVLATRTIRFASQELTDEEIEVLKHFLEAAKRELETFRDLIRNA